MKKVLATLLLPLLLAACGFHLRGAADVPLWLNNVYIMSEEPHNELITTLKNSFRSYHIQLSPNQASSKYLLVIKHVDHSQQITSVGSGSNPRQYQLIYSVDFQLQSSDGKNVKPLNHFSISRQITINNDRILGSNEEAEQLIAAMRQDAAIQIINRISRQS